MNPLAGPALLRAAEELGGLKVDGWEVFLESGRELSLGAKEGQLETVEVSREAGLAVRVFTGRRVGSAFSYDLSAPGVSQTIDQARQLAELSQPDEAQEATALLSPPPGELPELETVDGRLEGIDQRAKARRALEMEAAGLAYDRRVAKVRRAGYAESREETWLLNSRGAELKRERTICRIEVVLMARQGEESQMGYDFDFSPFFAELDFEASARRAAERAVGLLGARKAKTGPCPVVLDNATAAELLAVLAPAFLAENVQKGKSLLAGRLGQKVFSEKLGIIDDGLLAKGAGSRPFDDEGTPQRASLVVDRGVVQGLLYDRLAGSREGRDSTGNGRRESLKSAPGGGVTNFFVQPGQGDLEELVSRVTGGLLITELMGLHTADPISGEFSLGACGHWIEAGRRAWPVAGAAVSGNMIDLFSRVAQVGRDLRFLGRVGSPSLLIDRLDVAG